MKPGRKSGTKGILDRVKCTRGHVYDKHGYRDSSGNRRCRACTKLGAMRYAGKLASLNARRAKSKKGAVKKLHGNFIGKKKKKPTRTLAEAMTKVMKIVDNTAQAGA